MKLCKKTLLCALALVLPSLVNADELKTLRVATEPSFAPFEFMDPASSELIGFDMDIINEIAKVKGYDAQISSMPFDGLIPAILTSQIDVAISGFTITEERKKTVNFSSPYYEGGLGALVNSEYKDQIKTVKDLEGKIICAQIGTSGAMYAQTIPGATVNQFNTSSDALLELNKGSCVASVNDKPIFDYYLATTKNNNLFVLDDRFTDESLGIVTSKNNPELTAEIEDGLKQIKANGTYDKLYQKWFGNDK